MLNTVYRSLKSSFIGFDRSLRPAKWGYFLALTSVVCCWISELRKAMAACAFAQDEPISLANSALYTQEPFSLANGPVEVQLIHLDRKTETSTPDIEFILSSDRTKLFEMHEELKDLVRNNAPYLSTMEGNCLSSAYNN
jgi:hypothetical protein